MADMESLQLIHVVFRHGSRTPRKLYPKRDLTEETFYPFGLGGLTNYGKEQCFQIGKTLRKRYASFLDEIVGPNTVSAKSTDIIRAKESLQLVLAGVFPPKGPQVWNETVHWQPIATTYLPFQQDKVFFGCLCEKMRKLLVIPPTSEDELKKLIDYAVLHTGGVFDRIIDVMDLHYNLECEEEFGLELPEWTKEIYPGKLRAITGKFYESMAETDEQKRHAAGFLVEVILQEMEEKIGNKSPKGRQLHLYSGHELQLAFLRILLDLYDGQPPPSASFMIFELHKIGGEYFVKILFQDYQGPEPKVLQVPGVGEDLCPFNDFQAILSKFLPLPEDVCFNRNLP